ncbi:MULTISPECIES: DUF4097 family beta strand repeat-containing protein [unclassified Streptococcus]|uniref:DUF4097 family beta strand repeat-containing protein n=1 Tax=unclassified Streptococcus TaxID=2608887 RepID=UPI00359EE6C0
MKKITLKSLFIFGFASLIIGLVMVFSSLLTGGFDQLRQLNQPVTVTKTYTDLKSIDITATNKYIDVYPSDDDKIHLTYHYWEDEENTKANLSDANGKLSLSDHGEQEEKIILQGGLNVISKITNSINRENGKISLALPKGITLDELRIATHGSLFIRDAHIKSLDVPYSHLDAQQLTVDKGHINNGTFYDSHLKNITSDNYYSLHFNKTTLDGATITYNSDFSAQDSIIKNSTIKGEYAPMQLKNTTLDNSKMTFSAASISAENLTVLGDVTMTTSEYLVDISLSETSKNNIDLDLTTSEYGQLTLDPSLKDITDNDQKATRSRAGNKNKLTIINDHADIKLR